MRIQSRKYQIGGSFGMPRLAMFRLYERRRGLSAWTSRIFGLAAKFRLCELFGMTERTTIASLRQELGLTLDEFGAAVGISSKGQMSLIERGLADCSVKVALAIEQFSKGRIDASGLSKDVSMARASCAGGCVPTDTSETDQSSPGSADAISRQDQPVAGGAPMPPAAEGVAAAHSATPEAAAGQEIGA